MAAAEAVDEEASGAGERSESTLVGRAAGAAARFAEGYFELAQREAKRDAMRFAIGVGMLVVAMVLTLASLVLLQAFIVALLHHFGLAPYLSLGILLGANIFLVLMLLLVGRSLVRAPLLPQSRKMLRETLDVVIGTHGKE